MAKFVTTSLIVLLEKLDGIKVINLVPYFAGPIIQLGDSCLLKTA